MERLKAEEAAAKMRQPVLDILIDGLWHTTHKNRYDSIIRCGGILPDPDIPDRDRMSTSRGPDFYPYVRTLGGVSLFEFEGFDAEGYSARCPMSSWQEFVPYRTRWGSAVWIEINRETVQDCFIPGTELWEKCERENALRHKVMPHIEAAYIGKIPTSSFLRAFLATGSGMKDIGCPE